MQYGYAKAIAEVLKRLRKANNEKQQDLAKRAGISIPRLSEYEKGASLPALEPLLPKIAAAYGIRVSDIIAMAEDLESDPTYFNEVERDAAQCLALEQLAGQRIAQYRKQALEQIALVTDQSQQKRIAQQAAEQIVCERIDTERKNGYRSWNSSTRDHRQQSEIQHLLYGAEADDWPDDIAQRRPWYYRNSSD